jgi:hypothetical protein
MPSFMVIDDSTVPPCIVVQTDDDEYAMSVYTTYAPRTSECRLLEVNDITPQPLPALTLVPPQQLAEIDELLGDDPEVGEGMKELLTDLGVLTDKQRAPVPLNREGVYPGDVAPSAKEIERRVLAGKPPTVERTGKKPES